MTLTTRVEEEKKRKRSVEVDWDFSRSECLRDASMRLLLRYRSESKKSSRANISQSTFRQSAILHFFISMLTGGRKMTEHPALDFERGSQAIFSL
jgi:hypothetical protein